MGITEIQKSEYADEYPYVREYPCWQMVHDTKGKIVRPIIICKCGKHTNISRHHIHKDGNITASYYHKYDNDEGCGWHVYLKLKDWIGLEFLPNEDYPAK